MKSLFVHDQQPHRSLKRAGLIIALLCFLVILLGLYLQHGLGLVPCPMCIVQRYLVITTGVFALLVGFSKGAGIERLGVGVSMLSAATGAGVAARQSWLQWFPPEFQSCGRDLFGMIESFPLQRVLPMLLKGDGDCSSTEGALFGVITIANGSFLMFTWVLVLWILALRQRWR